MVIGMGAGGGGGGESTVNFQVVLARFFRMFLVFTVTVCDPGARDVVTWNQTVTLL